MNITLETLILGARGELYNVDPSLYISGIEIDSRKVTKEKCFMPILGERFDGHVFIHDAFKNGCQIALCEKAYFYSHLHSLKDLSLILVDNTTKALHRLTKYVLEKTGVEVIGITGSVGKTTTKELIYAVLSQTYRVHKNSGNYNNHIGMPLTVFDLDMNHEIAILEMGMNHFKEIETLVDIARPKTAVITNIGKSHIGILGSQENIFTAKMEIATYLKSTDTLILNGVDPYLSEVYSDRFHILKIGTQTLIPYDIKLQANGAYAFKVDLHQQSFEIHLNILGKHNIYNSLLAFSVGLKYQVPVEKIISGIESLKENKGRLDIFELQNNNEVISDCYNASDASVKSALEVLSTRNKGSKIAVLGDILELGDFSQETHKNIGEFIASQPVDLLMTFGKDSEFIGKAAVNLGFSKERWLHFTDMDILIDRLMESMASETCVLIKGSLGMGMARIVEALIKE